MRELLDDIFTNTSLELSSTLVNELIKQSQPAKLVSVDKIKREDHSEDIFKYFVDEYAVGLFSDRIFFILNTETCVLLTYNMTTEGELEFIANHIRLIASAPTDFKLALVGGSWSMLTLLSYFPLFKHGVGLIYSVDDLPADVQLTLLGRDISLYSLKDNGKLYGLRIYVSWLKGYRVIELIASDLAKQIPEPETISKSNHLVEIKPNDPLLKHREEIDICKIGTARGWGYAEIVNNNLVLLKRA